tara:strand:- start:1119 stop:1547 length:429 start_codon:yes stop_codon:yes gene_type:complete
MRDGIYFDGSADPNPGKAAFGFSHIKDNVEVAFECGYIGNSTNNMAEYTGLLKALLYCKLNDIDSISIYGDSQLVVNQVNEVYRVKSHSLRQINTQCKELMKFLNVRVQWIDRNCNQRADFLSKIPGSNACFRNGALGRDSC